MNIKNLPITFLLCSIPIVTISIVTFIFMRRAYVEGKRIGIEKAYMKKVMVNSLLVSIIPTLPSIITLAALMPSLGKYVPWFRLSVIGAPNYEAMAADTALKAAGFIEGIGLRAIPDSNFISVVMAMSVGCIPSLILSTFVLKKYDAGLTTNRNKVTILSAAAACSMVVVLAVLTVPRLMDFENVSSGVGVIVSMIAAIFFRWVAKVTKLQVVSDFVMPLSMVAAMIAVVLINL